MELRSTIRLVSDGTVEWVDLTFEIHPEDDLHVYFDGDRVEQGWTLMQESTPQRVVFDEPIPDGVDVIIRRASDLSEVPHVFHYTGNIKGGAEFNAKNMDENFAKILRASEDAMDSFELVGINVEAALDANLAADRAEAAAEDAEQSYQKTLAYDQQGEQWMLAAQAAAIDAESSKDLAYRWANEPEDQPVEQGEFSAYHWAKKAQEFVGGPYLLVSNNLSEVDPEVARDNLGLGSAAGVDVVQGTGNSEDDVMSQKATTDALNTKNTQGTGSSQTRTNSQNDSRFIQGGSVVQGTGSSTTDVMSQKAVTDALPDIVTSKTDTSGGDKVITQGWMGLGATQGLPAPNDLNNAVENGFYHINGISIQNAPTSGDGAMIVVGEVPATPDDHQAGDIMQIATMRGGNDLWIRGADNADSNGNPNWGEWKNIMPLGVEQWWQDVTGSRSLGTTYTNTTGRPIMVSVNKVGTSSVGGNVYVDNLRIAYFSATQASVNCSFIVPAGSTYRIQDIDVLFWAELR